MFWPPTRMQPASGSCNRVASRPTVLFPEPLKPRLKICGNAHWLEQTHDVAVEGDKATHGQRASGDFITSNPKDEAHTQDDDRDTSPAKSDFGHTLLDLNPRALCDQAGKSSALGAGAIEQL